MPLTGFPNSNHHRAVKDHAATVLRGLQQRDKNRPVTARQITAALDIPVPAVRAIVHYLREEGHPIGSKRIRSMSRAASGLRKEFGG